MQGGARPLTRSPDHDLPPAAALTPSLLFAPISPTTTASPRWLNAFANAGSNILQMLAQSFCKMTLLEDHGEGVTRQFSRPLVSRPDWFPLEPFCEFALED